MKNAKPQMVALALLVSVACTSTENRAPSSPSSSESSDVQILAASDCPHFDCGGPLEPGQYQAAYFDPTIAFEIATPGWTWSYRGSFAMIGDEFSAGALYSSDGIYFLRDPAIASQDCDESVERGVGRSVDDLVAWLEAAPGLATSEPTPVTVGGLDGMLLDIQLDPEWKRPCFFSEELPAVPLIFRGTRIGGYHWAIVPDQLMRWYILDSDDGVIIVDIEDNPDGLSRDELLGTSADIVDSIAFSSSS